MNKLLERAELVGYMESKNDARAVLLRLAEAAERDGDISKAGMLAEASRKVGEMKRK